jgi:hypothetical protein
MDISNLRYDNLELPFNVLTMLISFIAVIYWIKLFRRIHVSGNRDNGWLWIFASVLMVLLFNVLTLMVLVGSGDTPLGQFGFFEVNVKMLDLMAGFSRIIMAILLTIGAFTLYAPIKASGDKFVFSPVKLEAEEVSHSDAKYDIMPGKSYLVREGRRAGETFIDRRTVTAMHIFADLVTHGKLGLCVTRKFPPLLREEYNIVRTPMIWLTQESGYPNSISPTDLVDLSHMIKDFIMKAGDTIVLFEGVEYLVLHNNFNNVLMLIQGLDDVVVQNKSRLIVAVDPTTLTEQQLHLLERELEEFIPH